jgi:hypothetical protein
LASADHLPRTIVLIIHPYKRTMAAPLTPAAEEPWVEVTGSPHLADWLAEQQVSLAFTTYQTGKLFLLGRHPDGRLMVFERSCGPTARPCG